MSRITAYQCGTCGKCFSAAFGLSAHIRTVHAKSTMKPEDSTAEEYQFECYICKKAMLSLAHLRLHLTKHDEKPTKRCIICKILLTPSQLDSHLCRSEVQSINCEYCSMDFKSITMLLKHIEDEHLDNRLYKCLKCALCIPMKLLLEYHQSVHLNVENTFACDKCPKKCSKSSSLRAHIKYAHTMDRSKWMFVIW